MPCQIREESGAAMSLRPACGEKEAVAMSCRMCEENGAVMSLRPACGEKVAGRPDEGQSESCYAATCIEASSRIRLTIDRSPLARWEERCSTRPISLKVSIASVAAISEARRPE